MAEPDEQPSSVESDEPVPPASAPKKKRDWKPGSSAATFALFRVVVGAIITGGFQYLSTDRQVSGATDEALRSQQQAAYSKFLSDYRDFDRAAFDYSLAVQRAPGSVAGALTPSQYYAKFDAAYKSLSQDVATIEVVGTSGAVSTGQEIFYQVDGFHSLGQSIEFIPNFPARPNLIVEFSKEADDPDNFAGVLNDFIVAARQDVASAD